MLVLKGMTRFSYGKRHPRTRMLFPFVWVSFIKNHGGGIHDGEDHIKVLCQGYTIGRIAQIVVDYTKMLGIHNGVDHIKVLC
jgi:hypothetical protein